MKIWVYRLALIGTAWTLFVVVVGAFVRLSDAGLGCPDWPGCFGQITAPQDADELAAAQRAFPNQAVDYVKALREMQHRYFASILGLLIVGLAVLAWRNRVDPTQPLRHPVWLVALVCVQGIFGMLTVTEQLNPTIVTLHLLGGMATLSLIWLLALRTRPWVLPENPFSGHRFLGTFALLLVISQIALGGWTSANYAALACPDLPGCQGQWWPETDFREGFVLWRGRGINYEGGILGIQARTAINYTHTHIGATIVLLFIGGIGGLLAIQGYSKRIRRVAAATVFLVLAQVSLGLLTVKLGLPLVVAVAHNGTAALLLLSLITLNYLLRR